MKNNRYSVLAAGIVIFLFAGIIYGWSILKRPFLEEFGWDQGVLGLNFTLLFCGWVAGGMIGGVLLKHMSPRKVIWIAAILTFTGFFMTSRLSGDSVVMLYIAYAGFCGVGIGVVYPAVLATVSRCFEGASTTASGLLMMSYGLSTLILGTLANMLMDSIGWRSTFVLLAIAEAVVFVACSFFIKEIKPSEDYTSLSSDPADIIPDIEPQDMIRKGVFWKLFFFGLLVVAIGMVIFSFARDVSIAVGSTESGAVLIVGFLAVCNGLGRAVGGFLFDRIGRRRTVLLTVALALASTIVSLASVLTMSVPLNTTGLLLAGMMYGFMPPISVGNIRSLFGVRNFAINFSVINILMIFSSFSSTIGGFMIASTGSFTGVFVMMLCFALGAAGIYTSLKKHL